MLNGVHTFWITLTSVLDYISFVWVDHIFLLLSYYIFNALFSKWLNLNHFRSLSDSLRLPVTVKRFLLLVIIGCFSTRLVYDYHTRVKLIFLKFGGAIHYDDVIMGEIASQITSLTIVYSAVYLDAYQRKYQSSASLAFVRGIHQGPVNSPHKWPVTRKMFPFDDVIMLCLSFVFYFAPLSFCNMLR